MAYNEQLANRTREIISRTNRAVEEKRMFGGLCFMVDDKMCVGVESERLMIRLDPDDYEKLLEREGCTPMDFTGKRMKGYVFVDRSALTKNSELAFWVGLALDFNLKAKVAKKKKK